MPYLIPQIVNLISKEKESWQEKIFLAPLNILSLFYGWVVAIRLFLYARGIKSIKSLPAKVISVGNITLGGTGKTPLVICLAGMLQESSWSVSILSRGYKGNFSGKLRVVSNGQEILSSPEQAGDEAYLLAKKLPGCPVIISPDRYFSGLYALQNFKSKILILDDGYQHLSLKRDLNLLLIDAALPFGNGWLFPRGILREPINQLRRADAIILTKASSSDNILKLKEKLIKCDKEIPIFQADYVPGHIWIWGGETHPPEFLNNKRVFAFCGIGRPQSFKETLLRLQPQELKMEIFPDHHWYSEKEWQELLAKAMKNRAEILITTEKDWVRLKNFSPGPIPLGFISIRHGFINNDLNRFKDFVFSKLDLP